MIARRAAAPDRPRRPCSRTSPRAVDLARQFLAAGLPVCIGGFPRSPAASPCCRAAVRYPGRAGARRLLLRRRGRERRLDGCCATPGRQARALYNLHGTPRRRPSRPRSCRRSTWRRTSARCRASISARLSLPMLVLHHHQRQGRKSRFRSPGPGADRAPNRRASTLSSSPTTIARTSIGSRCSTA